MIRIAITILFIFFTGLSWGDIYVVTNVNNPYDTLSKNEIRDFYLGRRRAFDGADFTHIFDRGASSDLRATFFRTLTGMQLRQVDAFWARLVFAGRMMPLKEVESKKELTELIASTVNSIGYMRSKPESSQLKTLLVLPSN